MRQLEKKGRKNAWTWETEDKRQAPRQEECAGDSAGASVTGAGVFKGSSCVTREGMLGNVSKGSNMPHL